MAIALLVAVAGAACDDPVPAPVAAPVASPTASTGPSSSASPGDPVFPSPTSSSTPADHGSPTVVVWAPGGITEPVRRAVAQSHGVAIPTTVTGGLTWVEGGDGRVPPPGYGYPFEVAYVEPSRYFRLRPPTGQPGLRFLEGRNIVLAETAAGIRRVGPGDTLIVDGRRLRVAAILPDEETSGYEGLLAGPPPPGWGDSFMLAGSKDQAGLRRAVRRATDDRFRIRSEDETPFLRYADGVTPQMFFKEHFGEFAARVVADGRIDVHQAWRRKNIVRVRLPIVGPVTCHRDFLPQVRAGLIALAAAGLTKEIKPEEFAGCYSPRFIGSDPSGRLSSHAWGAAVDLNAASNPFGSAPTIDPRVVHIFKLQRLNWGGDWLVQDGMHFEWAKIPTDFSQ